MCGSPIWRPFGTYTDQTRTPSQVAPIARASAAGSGSPHVGMPGKPTSTSVSPTRLSTATPFHWFSPWWATS